MKFTVYVRPFHFSLFLLIILIDASGQEVSKKALKVFTPQKFQTHINYLASDSLLGRNTPSSGLDSAAAYIAREFKKAGLSTINGTYFSPLPLVTSSLGKDNSVVIEKAGKTLELELKTGFIPFEMTATGIATGEVVFAGYGITAPEANYDDYSAIDVRGKIVLILSHGPRESDTSSLFYNKGRNKYSNIGYKADNAISHGAIGLLFLTDPANHLMLTPRGYPWPSLLRNAPTAPGTPRLKTGETSKIPVVHVGPELIDFVFGSQDSLKRIQAKVDQTMMPLSLKLEGITSTIRTTIDEQTVPARNVAGFLRGSDASLRDEILIIGAHYDHVGYKRSHEEGEDYIMNGADDNASGTTGVLMIAEAFSKIKKKPPRSILFIAFAGEEKGLYGSKAYVENPLFPLEKTIGMLNLDMISRNSPDSLFLEGSVISPDLTEVVKEANKEVHFKLVLGQETYMSGSDHAPFYHKKVPFVFFFAGLHPDYHTIRDNPETIDAVKGAKVAQLVFRTASIISNENRKYTVLENKRN